MDTPQLVAQSLVRKWHKTRHKERDLSIACHVLLEGCTHTEWSGPSAVSKAVLWFLHKESMGKSYHVFWSSSIKAGRDAEWGCGTTCVSLFHWWLGLVLLKVILCPMEHRNQPDISHHVFNFRRESMTLLLWGHGIRTLGYLKKIINYGDSDRGEWKCQPYHCSVPEVGTITWICKANTLKFNHYGKSNFPLFISVVCEWHTYLSKCAYFVYGLLPLIFVQQRWEFISKSSPENEEIWTS